MLGILTLISRAPHVALHLPVLLLLQSFSSESGVLFFPKLNHLFLYESALLRCFQVVVHVCLRLFHHYPRCLLFLNPLKLLESKLQVLLHLLLRVKPLVLQLALQVLHQRYPALLTPTDLHAHVLHGITRGFSYE